MMFSYIFSCHEPLATAIFLLFSFSASKGIAGYAASKKEIVNLADAVSDARFDKEVDKLTGSCR